MNLSIRLVCYLLCIKYNENFFESFFVYKIDLSNFHGVSVHKNLLSSKWTREVIRKMCDFLRCFLGSRTWCHFSEGIKIMGHYQVGKYLTSLHKEGS